MSKGVDKKSDQLGMKYGTACNQLRKLLLFDCAKVLKRNICFRCGQEILSAKEFSIDHIEPWLESDDPINKFFDINNIAFTHLSCNVRVARKPTKIKCLPNQAWCSNCKQIKSLQEFSPSKIRDQHIRCRACNTQLKREYRLRTGKR